MNNRSTSAIASALLLLTGVALAGGSSTGAMETATSASSEQAENAGGVTTIIAVLRPRGFEPARVAVPQGKVVLLVVNRVAATGDPDLTTDDDLGQIVFRAKASERGAAKCQTFNVSRGRTYKVRLSNHSTAVFEIEVQQ